MSTSILSGATPKRYASPSVAKWPGATACAPSDAPKVFECGKYALGVRARRFDVHVVSGANVSVEDYRPTAHQEELRVGFAELYQQVRKVLRKVSQAPTGYHNLIGPRGARNPYQSEWQRAQLGIARNSARRYAVYAAARWQSQPSVPPDPIQKPGVTMSQKIPRKKSPL